MLQSIRIINFLRSCRKAWSILNNFTGRSRNYFRHFFLSADGIAFQLVRNERYEAIECKLSWIGSQQVSYLWRATAPNPVNISDTFSQREFTAALQHIKPGNALGPDSICIELIIHVGATLKC